jgi:outer membrane murein-binding lipoprotein Lpp
MRQQINLYQPILRAEPKIFGARTAAVIFAVVLGALVLMWGYGTYRVGRLEQTTQSLRDQQTQLQQSLTTASTMSAARQTPAELTARVKRAEEEVVSRTRALNVLRAGAIGRTTGFALRLEALARRHLDGVWIDRMALSGSTEAMSIGGATFDPDLVPRYLQSLSQEPVLAGARFDQLAIDRPNEKTSAQLRFRASSLLMPVPDSSQEDAGGST